MICFGGSKLPTTARDAVAFVNLLQGVHCMHMEKSFETAFAKLTKIVTQNSIDIASLAKTVETGFAAVAEDIASIKANMATKDELGTFREEFNEFRIETRGEFRQLRHELANIHERLEALEAGLADVRGFAKEIDALRSRLSDIERHLGLNQRIAA
jgi:predicted RNase H-like nuclease (RuvC/YqgF family)